MLVTAETGMAMERSAETVMSTERTADTVTLIARVNTTKDRVADGVRAFASCAPAGIARFPARNALGAVVPMFWEPADTDSAPAASEAAGAELETACAPALI